MLDQARHSFAWVQNPALLIHRVALVLQKVSILAQAMLIAHADAAETGLRLYITDMLSTGEVQGLIESV